MVNKTFVSIAFSLCLTGCAFHTGMLAPSLHPLNENFHVKGIAIGKAVSQKIFFVGGLDKETMVLDAKKDLYKSYPLQAGQFFANYTLDFNRTYFLIYSKEEVTVSAEIVDTRINPKLTDSSKTKDFPTTLQEKPSPLKKGGIYPNKTLNGYSLGETIKFTLDEKTFEGEIIKLDKKGVWIKYDSSIGKRKSVFKSYDEISKIN